MNDNFVISEDDNGTISTSIDGRLVYFTLNKRRARYFAWRAAFFDPATALEGYGETVELALIDLWQAFKAQNESRNDS